MKSFTQLISHKLTAIMLFSTLWIAGLSTLSPTAEAAGILMPTNTHAASITNKSQHVTVTIEDGYAITQVDEVFHNPNQQDLEAIYSFPVPEKGTVSEFTMWIDGKPVTGEVLRKQQARQIYEEEKAAGRETGLTEKEQHYRFEVSVSPVRANSDQRIRFVYMQAVDIDTGMGRFVYPLEEGETDTQALSFWKLDPVVDDFSFTMKLRSSYPIDAIRLPAHPQAVINQNNPNEWEIIIASTATKAANNDNTVNKNTGNESIGNRSIENNKPSEATEITEGNYQQSNIPLEKTSDQRVLLDKDIVVYWRLAQNLPGSVDLVTYRAPDAKRGTYMMTVTPGDDLAKITEGRDWAFVLDMSGSMSGKYSTLVDGVQRALKNLNTNDRFRLIRFDDSVSEVTSNWVDATQQNITHWGDKLAQTSVGGGTNLYAGLKRGIDSLDADRTSAIILVTDGEANVGITEKKEFLTLMKGRDVRLFTAVMGNGANRPLLNSMAEVSHGFAVSVSNSDDIAGKLLEFTSKVSHQAFHDVTLNIAGVKTQDQTPSKPTTLYRGEQMVIFGHYWGSGEATVTLSGKISGEEKTYQSKFNFPEQQSSNPEIERLWAYAHIRELQDTIDYLGEEGDYKDAIIGLAVEHGLVTNYTSMLVMRDEQFAARGIKRSNRTRRAVEKEAAITRSVTPVQSRRVDTHQPMFKSTRSSHSSGGGGGAFSIELLFLLPLLMLTYFRKRMVKTS